MKLVRSLALLVAIPLLLVVGAAVSVVTQIVLAPFGLFYAAAFGCCAGQRI